MQPFAEANHNPVSTIDGDSTKEIIIKNIEAGRCFTADASSTFDPDTDSLSFEWFYYREAGTYNGEIQILDADSPKAHETIPDDAVGTEIHVILKVKDSGSPNLYSYRKVVIDVIGKSNTYFK
ncbi:hypothetical protein C8N25_107166 [Algoriphagus antarcticus]|uniref:Cellulose-binding Sde182 C-terminal domain-containing protein n=2 Tax=Algoriphagus antarcticus TaxID=238540 RepID=A0A3E0E0L4_9BACT|nr:hypothetical protein C8N25_107166 [Algoriphagus antarcticus]